MSEAIQAIQEKWNALVGNISVLGEPKSDYLTCLDSIGRFMHFEYRSIYWTPETGAHELHGAIRDKWVALGAENSFLKYPVTDEQVTPDGLARFNHFQGGAIYWTPETGAHELHGAIRDKWVALGGENSFLKYPVTDEQVTPDGIGRFNHFQGGSIYWTGATGAHEIHGAILERWGHLGYERSFVGYPITDEMDFPENGRVNLFERGGIYWWPDTGAIDIHQISVHYTGLVCFGETDGPGSDEPYVVIGIVSASGTSTIRTPIYDYVDGGESRPDHIELYRGVPQGLSINILLMEHNLGDPEGYKGVMEVAVKQSFNVIEKAIEFIPVVGPILSTAIETLSPLVESSIANALTEVIGDRIIGGLDTINISVKQMIVLAAQAGISKVKDVSFKRESRLLSGYGASYKVYFSLMPV